MEPLLTLRALKIFLTPWRPRQNLKETSNKTLSPAPLLAMLPPPPPSLLRLLHSPLHLRPAL
jgi:hypothetical protein